MAINRNQFDKYYTFDTDNNGTLRITKNDKRIYPNWGRNIYLTYGEVVKSEVEAEQLFKNGKIDKTTLEEMYIELLGYTENEVIEKREQMDYRSYKYIKAIYDNMGYEKMEIDKKEIDSKYYIKKLKIDMFNEASLFKINDKYIIEFGTFCPPDDYSLTQIYFSKEPKDNYFELENKLNRAINILNQLYSTNKLYERAEGTLFNCTCCNKLVHWMDTGNNFSDRLNNLENRYCCE